MSISSSLESFSLPELFRLIEKDSKSGRLIVQASPSERSSKRKGIHYIWFQEGHLVAVSDCLNHKGLINLIDNRGWLSPPIVARLRTLCPPEMPLGIYLQKMKLLSPEKLSLIFQLQLHQVYQLFNLNGGRFRFDELAELKDRILTIPWLEMTGQKIRTTEVSMYALRLIDNWDIFTEQLPESNLALRRLVSKPHLKLTSLERQIWELADGVTSLINIAKLTKQPLKNIQITAFRVIAVGLVDEIFISSYGWQNYYNTKQLNRGPQTSDLNGYSKTNNSPKMESIETSFLSNVGQFIKRKFVEES
ncbi:MAG: hypothetical protein Tsb0014_36560 [Pleurocapsa sp.]